MVISGESNPNVRYDPLDSASKGRLAVRRYKVDATAEVVHDTIKRGKSGHWELLCDEGKLLGGMDLAPAPMQYFALAILF